VFANAGKRAVPFGIKKVVAPNGDVLYTHDPQVQITGIQAETVEAMNTALREAVLHGTGTRAAEVPNAHGKTGTTSEARDAWFAGYTPELATVIWMAHENRDRSGKLSRREPFAPMPGATGGAICCPTWRDFMLKAIPIQQAANKAADRATIALKEEEKKAEKDKEKPKTVPIQLPTDPTAQTGTGPGDTSPSVPPATQAGTDPLAQTPPPSDSGETVVPPPAVSAPITVPPPISSPLDSGPAPFAAPTGRAAPSPSGRRMEPPSTTRISEPTGRVSAPRVDPRDELVTVSVCADSGRRASQWCDATLDRRMRRRDAPSGRCRTHRPPPGEDG
jgi:hypothetical protein